MEETKLVNPKPSMPGYVGQPRLTRNAFSGVRQHLHTLYDPSPHFQYGTLSPVDRGGTEMVK
jgi:hypothetical protein